MTDIKIDTINGDCFDFLKSLPDNSVDMILTDPPYGTIKGMGKNTTRAMKDGAYWDVRLDTDRLMAECERVLRPLGCLVLFSQEPYTSELIYNTHPNLAFSTRYSWIKNHFGSPLNAKRAPLNYIEDVNVWYKRHYDKAFTNKAQDYANYINDIINIPANRMKKDIVGNITHFFTTGFQFRAPTESVYNQLIEKYQIDKIPGYLTHSELIALDKQSREKYKRVFNLAKGEKHKPNFLKHTKVVKPEHPTQKPVDLLVDLLNTYTNTGDLVIDFTMGVGSTAIACMQTGRNFMGCELDENYYNAAKKRIVNYLGGDQ